MVNVIGNEERLREWEVIQPTAACQGSKRLDANDEASNVSSTSRQSSPPSSPSLSDKRLESDVVMASTPVGRPSTSRESPPDACDAHACDCPDTGFDTEGWSSICADDARTIADDTLDMSAYSSSVSDACATPPRAPSAPPAAVSSPACSRDQSACPATSPPRSSSTPPPSTAQCREQGFAARAHQRVRAWIDTVCKLLATGAQHARRACAQLSAYLRTYQHVAYPALTGLLTFAVATLMFDNHRLRRELRNSCNDEKIQRLIVSGMRMKAALSNATDFGGSMCTSTLFL